MDNQTFEASYRPTLVVGLGGTGCRIVQKLKRLVQHLFGEQRAEAFQFLVLDTDVQTPAPQIEQLGPDVFTNLAHPFIPIRDMIKTMRKNRGLHRSLETWGSLGIAVMPTRASVK